MSDEVADTETSKPDVTVPPKPDTLEPEPTAPPKLDELQRLRLESLMWKKRAFFYRAQQTEAAAEAAIEDAKKHELELLRFARSCGIDIRRAYEVSDAGQVKYIESEADPKPTLPFPAPKAAKK
jgi:hypothetical protein